MKAKISLAFSFVLIIFTSALFSQWNYPATVRTDSIEIHFGNVIEDPYQWLEDMKNTEVEKWFKEQAEFTQKILDKIPGRDLLVTEMTEIDRMKKVKYSGIEEHGGRYFFTKRIAGEEEPKLYYRDGTETQDKLLFDPMTYQEGKSFSLGYWIVTDDGSKVMLGITESGKERPVLRVMNVDKKTFYSEEIEASYGSEWIDGKGDFFIYLKVKSDDVHDASANLDSKNYLHKLGDPVSSDIEILSRKHDSEMNILPEEYPIIFSFKNCDFYFASKSSVDNNSEYYYAPKSELAKGKFSWKKICSKEDEIKYLIANKNDIYLLSSENAPNNKVIRTSLLNPDVNNAAVVFENGDKVIESIYTAKDFLIITSARNGLQSFINKLDYSTGKVSDVTLPLKGIINVIPLNSQSDECIVYNTDWTVPFNIYYLNVGHDLFSKGWFYMENEYAGLDNIVSEELEVPSHDGILVPLTVIYDKTKFSKDGSNICYIEGYGAYGSNYSPYFNAFMMPVIQRGMVYAVAHVRGGGEKGEAWYRAGWKQTKPNTWKDFIACAEYLVDNNYTSKERLAGSGASAGGIMIGRAITERPDLFRAAVPQVGSLNTIRAEFSPNGPVNIPEFGTVAIEEEYLALYEMDAYMHIKNGGKYPATLITTGYNDPRVISWIPGKFAAKLQNYNKSEFPVLLKVDFTTGHFGGEKMSDYFKNIADIYSFVLWQCGNPDFQPKPD